MTKKQLSLFGAGAKLPEGFQYQPDLVSPDQEQRLVEQIRQLPLKEFEFQGYVGKRRVMSYGWQYDFNERTLRRSQGLPSWLLPLRDLQQALVTEYDIGAAIGWHRDKAMFGQVIGISLLSSCRFRLRRKAGPAWERASLIVEPRSAYLLSGASRTEWEHSIPAVDALRYSITFRNFRE
jgi:alkylated DNA repair dioxygenase AlkB